MTTTQEPSPLDALFDARKAVYAASGVRPDVASFAPDAWDHVKRDSNTLAAAGLGRRGDSSTVSHVWGMRVVIDPRLPPGAVYVGIDTTAPPPPPPWAEEDA